MESKKTTASLIHRPLFLSLIINTLLFAVVYLFGAARFLTNDDVGMMLWTAGVSNYSEPQSLILYTHFLIGKFLHFFYSLSLAVPWYALYLVFSIFTAHVVILYILLRRKPDLWSLFFYLIYFWIVGIHFLLKLQFTLEAALLCTAGYGLLLFGEKKTSSPSAPMGHFRATDLFGFLLVLLGSLVRIDSYYMISALFISMAAVSFLQKRMSFSRLFMAFLITGAAAFSFRAWDRAQYRVDKEWNQYMPLSLAIEDFVDFKILERIKPEDKTKALREIGWSENDYNMLMKWFYFSDSIYNLPAFEIARKWGSNFKQAVHWKDPFRVIWIPIHSPSGAACAVFLLILVMSMPWRRRENVPLLAGGAAIYAMLLYLILFKKPAPERVTLGLLIGWILPLLWSLDGTWTNRLTQFMVRKKNRSKVTAIILSLVLAYSVLHHFRFSRESVDRYQDFESFMEELNPTTEQLYVGWGNGIPWTLIHPFSGLGFLKSFIVYDLGGTHLAPPSRRRLESYGIQDLYLAIATDKRVQLVVRLENEEFITLYLNYMVEHYNRKLLPIEKRRGNDCIIYQFQVLEGEDKI